jgi:glucokinase
MLLAGDIGGTKTLLALYAPETGARKSVVQAEFHSADYANLDVMVREFLTREKQTADYACFDVAGPVMGGRAHLTNLPWDLEERSLAQRIGVSQVALLNDLKAVAYAVPHLAKDEFETINTGTVEQHGPIAVVAPGTGLGEAFLIWGGDSYIACSSEGGHAGFAPTNDDQIGLRQYLAKRFGHVSAERVCSGMGIANIYDFLCDRTPSAEPAAFAAELAKVKDRTPLISKAGVEDPAGNPLAAEALKMFVAILGDEASNLALKILSTGGVYLAGGIPARLLPLLRQDGFMQSFVSKGRLSSVLQNMPVHVVTASAALLGAALYGLDHMQSARA